MKSLIAILLIVFLYPLLAWVSSSNSLFEAFGPETPLMQVNASLGLAIPSHYVNRADPKKVRIGGQLISEGRADTPQGKSNYISRFYACTSCHNTVREEEDISKVDSELRLDYAIEHQLPYLQASTFWGIVNRVAWYNGDYIKKYGDLVIAANKSLEESIQLCAQECSQGRELEAWEMEAMLHYLATLELKVGDLALSKEEINQLNDGSASNQNKLNLIASKYLPRSPATFAEPPNDKNRGYGMKGNVERGKAIYELGCQHCHKEDGVSDLVLDDAKKTFKWLRNNISADSQNSIYEIIRHGTYAEYGHREYMPLYTQEKMSDQQVEDLRFYIQEMAY
jgi:mono/diheme cytochrome c family protein